MKLGFIGCGNMAKAMIGGIIKSGACPREDIIASDAFAPARSAAAETLGIVVTEDNCEVAAQADVLVLAVKPQFYEEVIAGLRGSLRQDQLIITIAPGKTLSWLAEQLGAKIVTVYGEDAAYQIAEYAIVSNVSKVVMGRTNHRGIWRRPRIEVMEKLTHMAPNIDVYIIPDIRKATHKREVQIQRRRKTSWKNVFLDLAEITGVMAVATLAAYVLWLFRLPESNIIMIYILGILLSSYIANKKIYALYSSLISVFAFNFFFTEPYFSLKAYDKGYPTTFVMLFLVGLFTATLTRRLKQQSRESAKKAYRTEILLENSQKLRRCKSKQEVWTQVAGQAGKLLNLSLIIYPMEGSRMSDTPLLFPRKGMDMLHLKTCINRQELAVAQWVAANHHRAGACTHTLPDAKAMYLPIQDARDVKGVMGILLEERRPIQEFEYGLLIAMLNETGVKLQDTFLE